MIWAQGPQVRGAVRGRKLRMVTSVHFIRLWLACMLHTYLITAMLPDFIIEIRPDSHGMEKNEVGIKKRVEYVNESIDGEEDFHFL